MGTCEHLLFYAVCGIFVANSLEIAFMNIKMQT